jgi:hypothetical protein
MTEQRISWECVLPDSGTQLVLRSNWILTTELSQAYLKKLIHHMDSMEGAPGYKLETRAINRNSQAISPEVGYVLEEEFQAAVGLADLRKTPSLKAAYLVLVKGMRTARAAHRENTTPQAVTNTLRKLRTALHFTPKAIRERMDR